VTFREKQAWIVLASTLAVYAVYFALVGRAWLGGEWGRFSLVGPIIITIIVLVAIQVVSLTVAAATAPSEARAPYDERDRLIDLQSARAGFYVLQTGILLALIGLAVGAAPALIGNALLAVMVAGEAARSLARVIGYRRSAA
jgi:hypothetical protein